MDFGCVSVGFRCLNVQFGCTSVGLGWLNVHFACVNVQFGCVSVGLGEGLGEVVAGEVDQAVRVQGGGDVREVSQARVGSGEG